MKINEIIEYNKNMKQQILNLMQDSRDFEYNKIVEYCKELNITVEPQRKLEVIFDEIGRRIFDSYNFINVENFKKALNNNKLTTNNNLYFYYEDKLIFTFDEKNNVFQVDLATDTLFTDLFYALEGFELDRELNNFDY